MKLKIIKVIFQKVHQVQRTFKLFCLPTQLKYLNQSPVKFNLTWHEIYVPKYIQDQPVSIGGSFIKEQSPEFLTLLIKLDMLYYLIEKLPTMKKEASDFLKQISVPLSMSPKYFPDIKQFSQFIS